MSYLINPFLFGSAPATDPYFANVSLLLNMGGADGSTTFTDEKGKTCTAVGAAQIDTSLGYQAALLDGSGSYVYTPDHADFDFGSGDFTVEAIIRVDDLSSNRYRGIAVHDQILGTRGWLLTTWNNAEAVPNAIAFAAFVGSTPYVVNDSVAVSVNTNYHAAAVREGGTLRLYKDGVEVDNLSISGSLGNPSEPFVMGGLWGVGALFGINQFNGFIRALRITKGVCRYPSGSSFTPPSAPFPNS